MPDDLYTDDILRWSDQQADLPRRLAGGERVGGERVNDAIDWENVIEEVESVGRSEMTAARGLLRHGLEHMLKLHGWPRGPREHWRGEVLSFLGDAAPPGELPQDCPFTLDELILPPPGGTGLAVLLARLAPAGG